MTTEDYKLKLKELHNLHEANIKALQIEYAKSNNPYKIGDKVKDHHYEIIIERMITGLEHVHNLPSMIYEGVWLKKDGSPNKKGELVRIYQININKQMS